MTDAVALSSHADARDGVRAARHVCMVAYTNYAGDARVRREAETLAAHGFRVRCLVLRQEDAPSHFALDGVEVHELSEPKYRGKSAAAYVASYVRFLGAASAACLRLLVRGQLDVVHVHNMPDFLVLAGLIPRLAGRKVVLDVHDSMPETFASKFSNGSLLRRGLALEERLSTLLAHRVICVNHPQRDVLMSRGLRGSKAFVSMNVPDPRIFGESQGYEEARPAEQLNLVYHGTMAERLGVDLLIQAMPRIRAEVPRARLHLWGGGDDLATFERQVTALGLEDAVVFSPGGFPLAELPRRLAAMDVGLVGNRRSAAGELMLPVKLLEYVSLGIPVVVPRLTTIRHYFSEEMVRYYEPENIDSMVHAVLALHRDNALRQRQATHAKSFLSQYGWHRQGQELVAMYHDLVGV